MSLCTVLVNTANGYFVAVQDPPPVDFSQCAGNVLLSAAEYSAYLTYTQLPPTAELQKAFMVGFTTPMIAYLIAYLVGRLINMFDD